MTSPLRGEIYYADLSPIVGSEQGGIRPVLVIQNNVGNKYSPTTIVSAITSKLEKPKLPTHTFIGCEAGLQKNSIVTLEQIRTIDKRRLMGKVGVMPNSIMNKVNESLLHSLELMIYSNSYRCV